MEFISMSRLACAASSPSFLRSASFPRPYIPSRVSIARVKSHNYNMINPKKRQRRMKDRWRREDLSRLDESAEVDRDLTREEDPMSDEELAELEEMEKEVMEGLDGGREPSDYDRRAHIFDESSRVFKVLKEKSENGGSGTGDGNSL